MLKKTLYVYSMLLGHKVGLWLGAVFILMFTSSLIYVAEWSARYFSGRFITLQAGPLPTASIKFDEIDSALLKEVLLKIKRLPDVEMARAGIEMESACDIFVDDKGPYRRNVLIRAVDLSYPPLRVKLERNGLDIDAECELFDLQYCRIRTGAPLKKGDLAIIKEIEFNGVKEKIGSRFLVKKALGNDIYLLRIYEKSDERVRNFRRRQSLSQFVPDLETCIEENAQAYLFMVVNYHKVRPKRLRNEATDKRDGVLNAQDVEVGYVLISQPLFEDLSGKYEADMDFRVELPDKTLFLAGRGVFNTKLNEMENDRVIVLSAERFRELMAMDPEFNNYIEIRLKDPDKVEDLKSSLAKIIPPEAKYRIKTWKQSIFEGSFKLLKIIQYLGAGFWISVGVICLFAVGNLFAVLYANTMHHQMLLRLVGLGNITPYYALVGIATAIPSVVLLIIIQSALQLSSWSTVCGLLAFQFGIPIVASIFFGWYYMRYGLAQFLQD